MWDGYYDLNGEMIQLPRWMCYDQQLTVVKQKCKEFVKVTIQWNWLAIWSRKKKVFILDFLFHLLFIFAHFWIFVSPFPDDQPQKEVMTVMNQWTNQLTKWWTNTSDGDVSYLTTDQFKVNSVNTIGNGERCEMDTTTWMVKWSNYQDGCVMTNSWLVKQKCKEFVKVTIQWNWLVICSTQIQGIYFKFSVWCICLSWHILVFLFHHLLEDQPQNEMNTVMDQRTSLVDKMVIQYFRWRCELLDNRPIQGEFSKDGWKWWKMWDGYYDLYGEMIQLPRWMCYDQQLTVVKQKCKEFVKVTIQWNWLAIWSRKKKVFILDFLFHLLFIFAHFWIFVSPFPDDQPQKEVMTVMNQWTNQLTKWWTNTSDGDVSYLTTDQFKVNSVNTIGNGERCEMDTTTWMVKWSNYQDGCVMTNSWQWWNKNVKNL